jgi:MFS family permease
MRLSARLLRVAIATGLASVGLAAGGTGGALLATQLAGDASVAGLPFGAVVAGSAAGAVLVSRLTAYIGRRRALAVGYGIGVVGAGVVIFAAVSSSLGLVLGGSLLLGPANSSVFLARYAGADLAGSGRRGRGLGAILFATALGAVVAPNLLGPSSAVAEMVGLSPYAGLYLVALVAFGFGALILAPSDAARTSIARIAVPVSRTSLIGLVVLGAANLTMVGIMAVAPVHLATHGHGLGFVGLIISIHVAGMLGPSPVTGSLADRVSPGPVAAGGAALLLAAGVGGALAQPASAVQATTFLLVLGLGWNLAVVAGSALLTADLPEGARPRLEAAGEVAMGLAAAVGAMGAGVIASAAGWAAMTVIGGVIGVLAAAGLLVSGSRHARTAPMSGRPEAYVRPAGSSAKSSRFNTPASHSPYRREDQFRSTTSRSCTASEQSVHTMSPARAAESPAHRTPREASISANRP